MVSFMRFWRTMKRDLGSRVKAKWSKKKCSEREPISDTEIKQLRPNTRILELAQSLPYFLVSPSCFKRHISSHLSGAFPLIPTWPVFCSLFSDTAGLRDISLAAFAIWSCLPSTLPCRLRLLETVISKHIYYFLLPGPRGARFLLLFDDAGQRQCYFTT